MLWTVVSLVAGVILLAALVVWRSRGKAGRVRLTINARRVLWVRSGATLLTALAEEGIQLPSTCGGQGSCALCRCRILRGGGHIQDRERPFFTPQEVEAHWRLACQVSVKGDLRVELPSEPSPVELGTKRMD